jgi:hypothetical protein
MDYLKVNSICHLLLRYSHMQNRRRVQQSSHFLSSLTNAYNDDHDDDEMIMNIMTYFVTHSGHLRKRK